MRAQLRDRLLAHVARLGPGWLHGQRSAELTLLATRGLDSLDAYVARYLPQLVFAAAVPLAVLAYLFPIEPVAAATMLVTAPLMHTLRLAFLSSLVLELLATISVALVAVEVGCAWWVAGSTCARRWSC